MGWSPRQTVGSKFPLKPFFTKDIKCFCALDGLAGVSVYLHASDLQWGRAKFDKTTINIPGEIVKCFVP
jgi:hypothetical protein